MEVGGDMRELALLRSAFVACDANSSGRLEREELSRLCAELRVLRADAEPVFQRLHADRDGAIITFPEFARGFGGARRGGRLWGQGPREPESAAAQAVSDTRDGEEDEGDQDAAAAALAAPWDLACPS
nr:LOW QUALITY PROTEIN: ras and EF-hand domain-containing protein [Vicugna pacos]